MKPANSANEPSNAPPSEEGWSEVTRGERFTIRTTSAETNGAFTMLEIVAEPRNGVPMHVHENEEEHFIVLEGTAHMANGDRRVDVVAGSSITVGKGVPHAWCNLSNIPLRMLVVFTPGGIEELFRQSPLLNDGDKVALANKYGTRITGPALFDDLHTIYSPRP
jgi:mannose-6-phosphate isomerase-like protein (cupin superfamily)